METLERQVLDGLRQAVGDETATELIDMYFEESASLLADIQRAVSAGDRQTVHLQAHTLKSTSAIVGANSLAEACSELEHLSARRLDGAARIVNAVVKLHSAALQELDSYRATIA